MQVLWRPLRIVIFAIFSQVIDLVSDKGCCNCKKKLELFPLLYGLVLHLNFQFFLIAIAVLTVAVFIANLNYLEGLANNWAILPLKTVFCL